MEDTDGISMELYSMDDIAFFDNDDLYNCISQKWQIFSP